MSKSRTPLTDAADDPTMRFSIRHLRLKDLAMHLELCLHTAEMQNFDHRTAIGALKAELRVAKSRRASAPFRTDEWYDNHDPYDLSKAKPTPTP